MANTQGKSCDVLIIGGGISGAAIAAECAQRGLAVLLCDRGDVGGASSSQSDQILPLEPCTFCVDTTYPILIRSSKRERCCSRGHHICIVNAPSSWCHRNRLPIPPLAESGCGYFNIGCRVASARP
ncbi:MAG: hypothetical protein CSH49_18950 [Alcanivorax sp.]|nr:MAG: hypothetical protein CSH49_18950 [Alcanivorax sp.]